MPEWLNRLLGLKPRSANQAKERLKLVLIHDRTEMAPGQLESMKDEILQVISRYVDIDPMAVRISMTQEGREQRLVADIPLKTHRKRRSSY